VCGRYRRTTSEEELARRYHIPIPTQRDLPISWNIAPTQDVLAIRFHPETKQRTLDALRLGLIPYWAKDPKVAYKTINARVETVDTAPSYRQAFKKRRCLIPADSFYEWKKVVGGKIPHAIGMKDDSPFVFAGLWEGWRDPASEEWIRTCTIITGEPNELVAQLHDRMPVRLGDKVRLGRNQADFVAAASKSARAGVGKRCGWKYHQRTALGGLGKRPPESVGCGNFGDQ
jgi:putative SOS response-associated peptidase YedK